MDHLQKPLRVAYLTGEYPKASHTFIQREVDAVREAGVEVLTVTVRETPPWNGEGEEERAARRTTMRLQRRALNPLRLLADHAAALVRRPGGYLRALGLALRTAPPGARGLLWQLFYFAEAGVLAAWLRRERVDHLHNHFANSSCSVAMLAHALGGPPFSFTMHGPSIFFEPMRWRIDEKIARARFVACISHFCRSQGMLFSAQAHWEKLKIVHCGVDTARYAPAPDRGAGGPRVLFVGRLAAVKGVSLLLDAFAAAAGPEARLDLVGDGPERAALERKTASLGIEERVTFHGYRTQSEVAGFLARADLFALPSFAEGVPVALMEAMAAELPVIAPRVAGVQELVEHGRAGLVTPPGDLESLAAALRRLLADPALRARMGAAGRERVAAEFASRDEGARLAALFRASAAGALPPGPRPDASAGA